MSGFGLSDVGVDRIEDLKWRNRGAFASGPHM